MANLPGLNQARPAQKNKRACAEEEARQQRLNKALRENLIKRKRQSRSRQQQQKVTKDSSAVKINGMLD
tara:strand:+ start:641 stop:847 length:207 start_codon:yes stop_codon:yes gene_type:complete